MFRALKPRSPLPLCCIGDFNDLLSHSEKKGRHTHPFHLIQGVRAAVDDCALMEIQIVGHQVTWEKSKGSSSFVEENLDKAFADSGWFGVFANAYVLNEHAASSDHSAICLYLGSPITA